MMVEYVRPGTSAAIGVGDRTLAAALDIAAGDTVRIDRDAISLGQIDDLGLGRVDRLTAGDRRAVVDFAGGRYRIPLDQLEVIERAPRPEKQS